MKIELNLDNAKYKTKLNKEKPEEEKEIKSLKKRIGKTEAQRSIDPSELIDAIKNGQTFTPGKLHGAAAKDWESQQIIVADLDNDEGEALEKPLTPSEALEVMKKYNIEPFFMYKTFSYGVKGVRFRIVLILDEVITDGKEARELSENFINIFNLERPGAADTVTINLDRIIYGSTKDCSILEQKKITPLETLRKLPKLRTATDTKQKKDNDFLDWESELKAEKPRYSDKFDLIPLLDYISPDDYEVWYKVGMALKREGYNVNDWERWSAKSDKYKPGECYKKWLSFTDTYNGEVVTGATITMYAKEGGYIPPKDRPRQQPPIMTDYKAPEPPGNPLTPEELAEAAGIKREVKPLTYTDETGADMMKSFLAKIQGRNYESIATGLSYFDRITDGGFIRGELVTLGAAPGAGKTMFAQMLLEGLVFGKDNADVLYINLEMSRDQLLARSISRILWTYKQKDYKAKQILRGYDWKEEDRKEILKTIQLYEENIANHFKYVNPDTNELIDIINAMQSDTDRLKAEGRPAPIVCIDYLQLITTKNKEATEGVKVVIKQLKDFAIKNNTCVFCIIAHNRASNETGAASVTSGRDTSAIEYSGDTMLTLSYDAIENYKFVTNSDWDILGVEPKTETDKKGNTITTYPSKKYDVKIISRLKGVALERDLPLPAACKHIMLKVVKSRFDGEGRRVTLDFDGKHATFTEVDKYKIDPWGWDEG